jgi:hypothetical protein
MFHPAAALHQPSLKTSVERDFSRLPEWIQQARQSGRNTIRTDASYAPQAASPAVKVIREQQASLLDLTVEEPETETPKDDDKKTPPTEATQLSLF